MFSATESDFQVKPRHRAGKQGAQVPAGRLPRKIENQSRQEALERPPLPRTQGLAVPAPEKRFS